MGAVCALLLRPESQPRNERANKTAHTGRTNDSKFGVTMAAHSCVSALFKSQSKQALKVLCADTFVLNARNLANLRREFHASSRGQGGMATGGKRKILRSTRHKSAPQSSSPSSQASHHELSLFWNSYKGICPSQRKPGSGKRGEPVENWGFQYWEQVTKRV